MSVALETIFKSTNVFKLLVLFKTTQKPLPPIGCEIIGSVLKLFPPTHIIQAKGFSHCICRPFQHKIQAKLDRLADAEHDNSSIGCSGEISWLRRMGVDGSIYKKIINLNTQLIITINNKAISAPP